MLLEARDPAEGRVSALLGGVREAWLTTRLGEYMPVTWMSYALDRALWGLDPFGYHLTSVLLHALAALSLYRLALLLMPAGLPWIEGAAALAALAFALHPLRVEPVAWASARGTVLGTLFALLAVVAYVAGARRWPRRALPARWLGLSLILYVVSLLARSTGAVVPAVLVLLDVYPLRRLGAGRGGLTATAVLPIWREKLWYAIPALASGVAALLARSWSGDPQRTIAAGAGPRGGRRALRAGLLPVEDRRALRAVPGVRAARGRRGALGAPPGRGRHHGRDHREPHAPAAPDPGGAGRLACWPGAPIARVRARSGQPGPPRRRPLQLCRRRPLDDPGRRRRDRALVGRLEAALEGRDRAGRRPDPDGAELPGARSRADRSRCGAIPPACGATRRPRPRHRPWRASTWPWSGSARGASPRR